MTRHTHSGTRTLASLGCVVLLLTLVLVSTPALGQADDPSASIENVTYTGNGSASASQTGLFLWQSASHQFTVTVSTATELDGAVCLLANETGRELGCGQATVRANGTERITVGLDAWPANRTGNQTVDVVLRRSNASDPVDRQSLAVTVLQRDGDLDGDGLPDEREVSTGTDPRRSDTDGDGLSDFAEVTKYDLSPVDPDSDADGLSDGAEVTTHLTNPMMADSDGDGLLDSTEVETGTNPSSPDSDGDGLTDAVEVNVYNTDPTSADMDDDGLDDRAELTSYMTNPRDGDTDDDELSDALEVYTYGSDPSDRDTDDDGLTDGEEVMEYQTDPTTADTDDDDLHDGAEVNTHGTNPLNADTDGDGLDDGAEVRRHDTNPLAVDSDGDGTDDGLEVQTGIVPGIRRLGVVAGGIVLTLTVATAGFYWVNGRVPGKRLLASLGTWVGTAGRTLGTRRQDDEQAAERVTDAGGESIQPASNGDGPATPLSNEDRVFQILDQNDGQVRQSDIVDETSWSKAKVSRVLSKMEAEGKVAKIDVGRENVVTYPEDVPSGATPPFES